MTFDWPLAIKRNSEALQRIIATLFAMAGIADGATSASLPHHLYRAILLVLRPAESAVRRLVIIAARGLVLKSRMSRPAPAGFSVPPRKGTAYVPAFLLIDPLKRFTTGTPEFAAGPMPHIRSLDGYEPLIFGQRPQIEPDEDDSPEQIFRRLHALKGALDDLPRQARRLARWRARRDQSLKTNAIGRRFRLSPFRPGLPPGHRQRPIREIDDILRECHGLALDACRQPNTT